MIWLLSLFLFSEEPAKITDEGVYYYKLENKKNLKEKTKYGEVLKTPEGVYYYKSEEGDRTLEGAYGDAVKIKGDMTRYKRDESPQDKAITIQFNNMTFDEFRAGSSTFEDVYGDATGFNLDLEWHHITPFAKLGYIFSTGVYLGSGSGRFVGDANEGKNPKEKYDLFIIPLSAKLRMNFEYSEKQYLVPYLDAGAGIFAIREERDDGNDNENAYTPIFIAGGGLNILLDWMNPDSIARLDNDTGINHIWLNIAYNLIVATDSEFDLSTNQIQAGFKFDY